MNKNIIIELLFQKGTEDDAGCPVRLKGLTLVQILAVLSNHQGPSDIPLMRIDFKPLEEYSNEEIDKIFRLVTGNDVAHIILLSGRQDTLYMRQVTLDVILTYMHMQVMIILCHGLKPYSDESKMREYIYSKMTKDDLCDKVTGLQLANGLTKVGASVREMLEVVQGGYLNVKRVCHAMVSRHRS